MEACWGVAFYCKANSSAEGPEEADVVSSCLCRSPPAVGLSGGAAELLSGRGNVSGGRLVNYDI